MNDSEFVAHFTKGEGDTPFNNLVNILEETTVKSGTLPWTNSSAACFTECPWSSLIKHVKRYSSFGLGFTKPHVFAAGGGPAYYVRADYWPRQQWENHVKAFVTPFWPAYRPNREDFNKLLKGQTVDYTHEREWRVPYDFTFKHDQVQFVVLPNYETMAKFPKELKDAVGREKFILVDVYQHVEKLWPTHLVE
ncbi:MAG: terminase [Gammaproteobacteria bacterium]|nr:terminase [Gammaproteobacteria bacterium]MYG65968.1 terminase [Gammaproteobacteria bacterium]